jgi:hypothetical protein
MASVQLLRVNLGQVEGGEASGNASILGRHKQLRNYAVSRVGGLLNFAIRSRSRFVDIKRARVMR